MKTTKHTRTALILAAAAMITAGTLQAAPTPDPMTWDIVPTAVNETTITMTATTATDAGEVEYYFTNTTLATDSGWQASPTWTNTGLSPGTSYSYNVKARELTGMTETAVSTPDASATTNADNGTDQLVYEPFAYPLGGLNGASGPYEKGLDGTWTADANTPVAAPNLTWGALPTAGEAIINEQIPYNKFGGARTISASALAANGLLDDGAVLWFSAIAGYGSGGNRTNTRLLFQLGDESLGQGDYQYYYNTPGATGIGFTVGRFGANGRIVATVARDSTFGTNNDAFNLSDEIGSVFGTGQGVTVYPSANTNIDVALIVGKITWAENPADPDRIELFLPDTTLAFPDMSTPHSVLQWTVDQSGYDTISWQRGDKVVLDEIRFGASYYDVIEADLVTTPDVDPPTPDPATFAVVPTFIDDDRITMTATVVNDPSEVEYYFAETSGNPGGADSDWQTSPTYINSGLTPATMYTYTVQTRDKSVAHNPGTASGPESATTPAVDTTPPTPNPMTFATAPTAISNIAITMTADTATDDTYGVEYLFTNTTLATDSGWLAIPTWTDTGLTPSTSYTYTVTARDTGPLQNTGTASVPVSTSTLPTDVTPPSPDPATWATAPTVVSDTEITMSATIATDDQYGVEYYFANLSVPDGSHDSGWQASPTYGDTGLNPFTSYTYRLTARDLSYALNETVASDPLPAVTDKPAGVTVPTLLEGLFYTIGSDNIPNPPNGPTPSINVDVSVFPGKAIYSGVGNWPNQNQNGSWFIYNYFGDGTVADYKFFAEDGTTGAILTYAMGEGGIIADVTTPDTNVDDAPWADVWTTADPGFDFTANPADFTSDTFMTQVADNGAPAISGTIDISGMNEGLVYILYGAYRNRPNIDVTMSGPGQTDVVLENIGDNDSANNNENYACSFSFFNAENYDTISFDYNSSNGRFLGVVVDGEITGDYIAWAANYPGANLTDPAADYDGDGLSNDNERLFGLDPTDSASVNPISVPFDTAAGTFSFTRRDDSLTGKFSHVETSTDLVMWTEDTGAALVSGTPDGNGVEIVAVTLSNGLLSAPKLFVRVRQDNDGVVFSANFEDDNGGFAPSGTPNDWAWGAAASNNSYGLILTGGNGGTGKCWGTNLGDGSIPSGLIDTAANSILRSPDIDLSSAAGADLQFAAAADAFGTDTLEVLVKEVGTGTLLETVNPIPLPASLGWANYGPFAIPAAAGKNVYLEFRFQGTDNTYIGLYIDDVTVSKVLP